VSKGLLACLLAIAIAFVGIAPAVSMAKEGAAANTVAVCGCGKIFVPDAGTKYITHDGKEYACCTEACHAMASKDPAGAAKMGEAAMAHMMAQSQTRMTVGNVLSVTDKGTKAMCGCGKGFMIDETTQYLSLDGESYACCSKACHEMASKDPAKAVRAAKDQMAAMK
jgi:YHS domain-containing protein